MQPSHNRFAALHDDFIPHKKTNTHSVLLPLKKQQTKQQQTKQQIYNEKFPSLSQATLPPILAISTIEESIPTIASIVSIPTDCSKNSPPSLTTTNNVSVTITATSNKTSTFTYINNPLVSHIHESSVVSFLPNTFHPLFHVKGEEDTSSDCTDYYSD